jgi:MFS transporter, FLVCR family, MFS-domain-containing protein 7
MPSSSFNQLKLTFHPPQSPVGYSADIAGDLGATLLLTGIVAAIITAPLFDRVLTTHLALTSKTLVPIVGVTWLAMIWAGMCSALG